MNRKQRRAALKQGPPVGGDRAGPANDPASQLFAEAVRYQRETKLNDAVRTYKRVLMLKPDHAEAHNNLGVILQTQGKLSHASAHFAQSLSLMPQLFEQYSAVVATLLAVLPPIGEAMRRATMAWPNRLTVEKLLGSAGLAAICGDPMLLCMLQSAPSGSIDFERLMTSLRLSLLEAAGAGEPVAPSVLAFCCAMAEHCFINEYIFATTSDEDAKVERLKAALGDAIKSRVAIAPFLLAAMAAYQPLYSLADARALLDQTWPPPIDDVLTQQLREPLQELQLRSSIPRLTPIEDDTSQRVRQQYEENPYPRWVKAAGGVKSASLDATLQAKFPTAAFTPLGKTEAVDILVAGCGTRLGGRVAESCQGARVLAVDLSLSSLCYAKRKMPVSLTDRIEYAQGDILKLGATGRNFDVIDASGVLHHMADPIEGWRILLTLLRPGGIMHLGLYSELGRGDVVAARAFIAERGYTPSPADIRCCRQDLLETPMRSVARASDFFTTSECRDLLFHVQESRTTIPAIKTFIDGHALKFIGFDLDDTAAQNLGGLFAANGWSMTDLDKWHAVETQYPNTFSTMYQFWVQKS